MQKLQKALKTILDNKPVAGELKSVRKEKDRQLKRCCSFANIQLLIEANEHQRDALKIARAALSELWPDVDDERLDEIDELIRQAKHAIDRLDV